jgi:hypothetical protein
MRFAGAKKLLLALLLAGVFVAPIGAQSASEPPPGTVAADVKARRETARVGGGLIDVTAISTTLLAFDKDGRAVLDLSPEELLVLEDGEPVRLLALEPGLGPLDDSSGTEGGESIPAMTTAASTPPLRPWRVVVYVSTELAGRFVLRELCQRTAGEATRLTDLGTVDVVLADPSPVLMTEAGRRPDEVRQALEFIAKDTSGMTTVERIRNSFTQDFKPGAGFDRRYTITQASPQAFATQARSAVHRERTVIRGELDRMVAWMQSQPPTARGLLVWMTGGFDLNPADFYIPLVEQIDSGLAVTLRSDYSMLSLEEDVRQMVEVALSYGWTVLPVNSSRTRFIYGAEVDGTGKVQHHQGVGAGSIGTQQGDFRQVAPNFPLQIIARSTGGEFVANEEQLKSALDHIRGAYAVTYQVERPVDGRLHRLEIRCSRPGVRLRGRLYAASGSLRGVSTTRAKRLLAGEEVGGVLDVTADVKNISKAPKGQQIGDLLVSADLGELRPTLSAVNLGEMRITVVVEVAHRPPFIHHQEIAVDWKEFGDIWQFGADIKWPRNASRLAVVVEELVSSTWGASVISLE